MTKTGEEKYNDFIKYLDENNLAITTIVNPTIDIIKTQNHCDKFEIQYNNKYRYTKTETCYLIKNTYFEFTLPINEFTEDTIKKMCDVMNNDKNVKQNKEKL